MRRIIYSASSVVFKMNPTSLEKLNAIALLLIGLSFLLLAMLMAGIQLPAPIILLIITALLSLVTGIVMFMDSRDQHTA